jgi:uncharacterized protein YceK
MKTIIASIIIALLLMGCATTTLTIDEDKTVKWESKTFLKNIENAEVQWGTFHAWLGSSAGDHQTASTVLDAAGNIMQCFPKIDQGFSSKADL